MRAIHDYNLYHRCVLFVDDHPDGGCIVQLPDGSEMNTKDMNGYEPFYDKHGKEVFYPGWAEW